MEYITMRNGTKVPMLGLGCYKSEEQEGVEAVKSAIEIGYRHIDTANFYENEKYVGRGIRESGIDREKLFVVSKIWPTSFKTPEVAIEYSMRALNIDYIDMYLLHWPSQNEYARNHAFETLLKYKEKGYFKEVGVSNFKKEHLEKLKETFGFYPMMNQIEISPWLQKKEDYAFCQENDIVMTACEKAVRTPEDLKGLKIRVMQSDNMVKMLQLMGGTGVPMSASEQYSAMQQGVVDGAESNEIDYVGKKYYEVAPVFSRTEHCFSTDFVVASTKFMNSLTDEDRKMIEDAMAIGVEAEFDSWSEMVDESIAEAEEKGIEFVEDVDKEAFAANFKEFQEQIANESTVTRKVYDEIKALREEGSNE